MKVIKGSWQPCKLKVGTLGAKYNPYVYLLGWHGPGLDHFFIQMGPIPPTPPLVPGLPAHTCVGTLPRWEPMWQYSVKITNIQVDITFIIPKLINVVPSHKKELNGLSDHVLSLGSQQGRILMQMRVGGLGSEGGVGGAEPNRMKMWSSPMRWHDTVISIRKLELSCHMSF